MGRGMKLNKSIITNGLIILTILSLSLRNVKCDEANKKEEDYGAKQSGYPGSQTNTGKKLIIIRITHEIYSNNVHVIIASIIIKHPFLRM